MRKADRIFVREGFLRAVGVGFVIASATIFTQAPVTAQDTIPWPDFCLPPERRAPDGACCPRGYRWDTTVRTCIQPGPWCYRARENFTVEIYPCCPGGNWPILQDGVWECPPRITAPPAAATVPPPPCPTGAFRNASGKCITITVKPVPIPSGSPATEPPPLPCPKGTVRDGTGKCAKVSPCPEGTIRNARGDCVSLTPPR